MKRGAIFIGLVFALVLLLNCFVIATSVPKGTINEDKTLIVDEEYLPVAEATNIGAILGLHDNTEIVLEKAAVRKMADGSVKIVFEKGGKISFKEGSSSADIFGESIDSKFLDLSKGNSFVFKNGVLISAEFQVKTLKQLEVDSKKDPSLLNLRPFAACLVCEPGAFADNSKNVPFILNRARFEVPMGSKVVVDGSNHASINPPKDSGGGAIPRPQIMAIGDSNMKPMDVSYTFDGDEGDFSCSGFGITSFSMREGTVDFFTDDFNRVDLQGGKSGKIVFGDSESSYVSGDVGFWDSAKVHLTNMEIDDKKGNGISLFMELEEDIKPTKPYILVSGQIVLPDGETYGIGGGGLVTRNIPALTACAPATGTMGCGGGGSFSQLSVTFNPTEHTDFPEFKCSPGNLLFPGMEEGQFVNINPSNGRAQIVTTLIPEGDEKGVEKVDVMIFVSGDNPKINNAGYETEFRQNKEGKLEALDSRVSPPGNNPYPLSIQGFVERLTDGSEKPTILTQYGGVVRIEGKSAVTVYRNLPERYDAPEAPKDENTIIIETTNDGDIPFMEKVQDKVLGALIFVFGYEKGNNLFNKLFPQEAPGIPPLGPAGPPGPAPPQGPVAP